MEATRVVNTNCEIIGLIALFNRSVNERLLGAMAVLVLLSVTFVNNWSERVGFLWHLWCLYFYLLQQWVSSMHPTCVGYRWLSCLIKFDELIHNIVLLQDLLTSLAANKGRLDEINKLADDILKAGTSQKDEVLKRKKEINDRWVTLSNSGLVQFICVHFWYFIWKDPFNLNTDSFVLFQIKAF